MQGETNYQDAILSLPEVYSIEEYQLFTMMNTCFKQFPANNMQFEMNTGSKNSVIKENFNNLIRVIFYINNKEKEIIMKTSDLKKVYSFVKIYFLNNNIAILVNQEDANNPKNIINKINSKIGISGYMKMKLKFHQYPIKDYYLEEVIIENNEDYEKAFILKNKDNSFTNNNSFNSINDQKETMMVLNSTNNLYQNTNTIISSSENKTNIQNYNRNNQNVNNYNLNNNNNNNNNINMNNFNQNNNNIHMNNYNQNNNININKNLQNNNYNNNLNISNYYQNNNYNANINNYNQSNNNANMNNFIQNNNCKNNNYNQNNNKNNYYLNRNNFNNNNKKGNGNYYVPNNNNYNNNNQNYQMMNNQNLNNNNNNYINNNINQNNFPNSSFNQQGNNYNNQPNNFYQNNMNNCHMNLMNSANNNDFNISINNANINNMKGLSFSEMNYGNIINSQQSMNANMNQPSINFNNNNNIDNNMMLANNMNNNYNQNQNLNNPIANNQFNINNNNKNQNVQNKNAFDFKLIFDKQSSNPCTFPFVGLNNVGLTCYMNSTLQCLLHIPELNNYFFNIYPNQKENLNNINRKSETGGKLSQKYYLLVYQISMKTALQFDSHYNTISPNDFHKAIGELNPQFRTIDANDSKDLLLFLFQSMHEELNYYGDQKLKEVPRCDQTIKQNAFEFFMKVNNELNLSIFSYLFYGIFESETKCMDCKKCYYNFQYFQILSFPLYNYQPEKKKNFNIYQGFKDYVKKSIMKGDNQCFCQNCRKLTDSEVCSKIYYTPPYLIINLDYGKNKKYEPAKVNFGQSLDLSGFTEDSCKRKTYELVAVSSHIGRSGVSGHYIAYCKNQSQNDSNWYKFNDSTISRVSFEKINEESPDVLIFKRVDD